MTAPVKFTVDARRWFLTRTFVLRVAGMPVDTLDGLASPETVRWSRDALAAEVDLDRLRPAATDALETAVAGNTDERLRRDLLAVRRDVFNGRLPRDLPAAGVLAARIGGAGGEALARWLARRVDYEDLLAAGSAVLERETATARAHLRGLADDPRLRAALLLSSPSLDRHLPGYLDAAADPDARSKRARRIERSVLEYVYRTACKTSPFSSFTPVALGRFVPGSGTVLPAVELDGPWRSHPRLNLAVLARLADLVLDDRDLRSDLPVRLTTGLLAGADRVRYVRRSRSTGVDPTPMELDLLRENLFYLNHGAVLGEVMAILGEHGELTVGQMAARLDTTGREPEDVARYLRHLLRLGLLTVPLLHVDIHAPDPVRAFRERLASLGTPWATATAARLAAVTGLVDQYARVDLAERRELLAGIRERMSATQRELGATEPNLPKTLVYEDVSVPGSGAVADPQQWWDSLLPALAQVARLLPVFDSTLPQRLSLRGFFTARFGAGGRCDDVLRFVHEFHQDYFERYLKVSSRADFDADGEFVPGPNWLRLPDIDALARARRELITRMRAVAASPTDVVLDEEFVDAVAARVPDRLLDFEPRSFFVQLGEAAHRPFAVVNRTYSGLSLLFSRFVHCFDGSSGGAEGELAAELRAELDALAPEGAVFAELTGGYDATNLNVHPAVTPYELVCPGDVSFRPTRERITVDELSVLHDPRTDTLRLHSWRLDREVIPVYLGFVIPPALPVVTRTMLLFSRNILANVDIWGGARDHLRGRAIRPQPRVRIGDVVLARRSWTVHPDHFPCRDPADTDAAEFLAWQRWRQANGLPRRVFASLGTALSDRDGDGLTTIKPHFVDFDSAFSVRLLDRIARTKGQYVVLEEMLPDVEHLWQHSARGRHVTELTMELTGTTRPRTGRRVGTEDRR